MFCAPCMSTFNKTLSSPRDPIPQSESKLRKTRTTVSQNHTNTPPIKGKKLSMALERLWTAIKLPTTILAKHWRKCKRLRKVLKLRAKQPVTLVEEPKSCPQAVDLAIPAPPSTSSLAIAQDRNTRPSTCSEAPVADATATDRSISLSSQPDITLNSTPFLEGTRPPNSLNLDDHEFVPDPCPGIRSSEASTLQNSTFVNNNNISRDPSEAQSRSISEFDRDATTEVSPDTPPGHSSLIIRPLAPRIQTSFGQLNVPGSDEEDGRSTIRGRGSSPASPVDFNEIGSRFDESPLRR